MFGPALIIWAALLPSAGTSPLPPTEQWATERLDLTIRVQPAEKKLLIDGRIRVRLEDESSDGPAFALNARSPAMRFRHLTASGRQADIRPHPEYKAVETAILELPATYRRGDVLEADFALESAGESSQLVVNDSGAFASWVESWYPVTATQQRGRVSPAVAGSTTFVLPRAWRSVSNGRLSESKLEEDARIERWDSEAAVARSFAAGPYASVEHVSAGQRDIAFYQFKERPSTGANSRSLAKAIEAMEARFGPYPYPSYTVAEVFEGASFAAGSEQGFIMVRSSVLDHPGGNLPLFAHEAGHGWWGNLMRPDGPGGKMMSEALAQYGAVLSIEAIEGKVAMDEFLRFSRDGYNPLQCALGYFHIWREGGDKPLGTLGSDPWDHNLSDSKGMWFYHMLRGAVGDEVFYATLRGMLQEFAGRQASLADLRRRFLDASKDAHLAGFLAQWLDRPGAPVLRSDWWSIERGKAIEIHIEQTQPEPFDVPLEIAVDMAGGATLRETLVLSKARESFTLATPARPLALRLDPDNRLLMWRPEFGPRPADPPPAPGSAGTAP